MTRRGLSGWIGAGLLIALTIATEVFEGRHPFCTCGHIALWHGPIDAETSQQILDWYSPSHLIHGLLFYAIGFLLLRRLPVTVRFLIALAVECGWEMIENSPLIIDRYRTATAALGYSGDSILNSMSDIACMSIGFLIARRLPWPASLLLAVGLELLTLAIIRDNLTLNVLMLVHPIAAIRAWQGAL